MKDNHSYDELIYKKRWITPLLQQAAKNHPVVVVTGARQVGKSTLLRHEKPFSQRRYLSLDDFDLLAQAEENPASLLEISRELVIDEVQKSPRLLSAIKQIVDKRGRHVSFVLSGSANLLLMKQVSESLAGRAVYYTLAPMTEGERLERPAPTLLKDLLKGIFPKECRLAKPQSDSLSLILRGFMPPVILLESQTARLEWWEGYVASYLERDLRQLTQIESLTDFRNVMKALALRSGQMLNQTEVGRDTQVKQPTVHRYLNLLEASCLLDRLPAFSLNRTTRLIKTPKIYWTDPALAAFLSGIHETDELRSSREAGSLFETLVYLHFKILSQLLVPKPRVFYWRTVTSQEVDFVIEQGRKLIAIEVKLADRLTYHDTESLRLFLKEYPETVAGLVIYSGNEIRLLQDKLIAIPWQLLCG